MKFLEIKRYTGFVRFSLESVDSYGVIEVAKKGKKKEHYIAKIVQRGYGETIFEFDNFEGAQNAMTIIDA